MSGADIASNSLTAADIDVDTLRLVKEPGSVFSGQSRTTEGSPVTIGSSGGWSLRGIRTGTQTRIELQNLSGATGGLDGQRWPERDVHRAPAWPQDLESLLHRPQPQRGRITFMVGGANNSVMPRLSTIAASVRIPGALPGDDVVCRYQSFFAVRQA